MAARLPWKQLTGSHSVLSLFIEGALVRVVGETDKHKYICMQDKHTFKSSLTANISWS
jgi:hypothetical protein